MGKKRKKKEPCERVPCWLDSGDGKHDIKPDRLIIMSKEENGEAIRISYDIEREENHHKVQKLIY